MTREEILQIAKPILFNTDMVQAILDDRKTTTRRLVKPRYRDDEFGFRVVTNKATGVRYLEKTDENEMGFDTPRYINPPYQVGDILYVRETWQYLYELDGNEQIIEGTERYYYAATDALHFDSYIDSRGMRHFNIPWRPSIHMPKEAARIFLRVTDVRVERLHNMTLDDFLSEGVVLRPEAFNDPDNAYLQARKIFIGIWNPTTDKLEYKWEADPWVWVIEFERCEIA